MAIPPSMGNTDVDERVKPAPLGQEVNLVALMMKQFFFPTAMDFFIKQNKTKTTTKVLYAYEMKSSTLLLDSVRNTRRSERVMAERTHLLKESADYK